MKMRINLPEQWVTSRIKEPDMTVIGKAAEHIDVTVAELRTLLEQFKALGIRISPSMWFVPLWQFEKNYIKVMPKLLGWFADPESLLYAMSVPIPDLGNKNGIELIADGMAAQFTNFIEKHFPSTP